MDREPIGCYFKVHIFLRGRVKIKRSIYQSIYDPNMSQKNEYAILLHIRLNLAYSQFE